jgi:hypothetical protein
MFGYLCHGSSKGLGISASLPCSERWIVNIKTDLLEIGLSVVDWIGLAQDRYRWRAPVNTVMNLWVP